MKRPPFNYPSALPLIPVYSPEVAEFFMGDGLLVRDSVLLANVQFETSPLRMDRVVNLLSISTQEALIARSHQGHSDVLLPKIYLRELYVRFGDSQPPIRFADMHLVDSSFEHGPEMPHYMRRLQMFLAHTTRQCGYELTWTISVGAEINLEFCVVHATAKVGLTSSRPLGDSPTLSLEEANDMEQKFMPEVLGYSLSAYRGNCNVSAH